MVDLEILKIYMRSIFLIVFYFSIAITLFAQEKKKLENVKGEWVVSNDITLVQAREKAIQEAKLEALRLAGVPEAITASTIFYRTDIKHESKEFFETLTTIDTRGEILEYSISKEEKKLNATSDLVYTVWIDAVVVTHKSTKDPGFNFDVKGVREVYSSPDQLSFEITPWKEGYLTVFILDEKESTQLFPNYAETQEKLVAKKQYLFPRTKALEYEVSAENAVEVNYLLLLFTKHHIPFTGEQTTDNILRFIAGIDPVEKSLHNFTLLIKKHQ